MQGYVIGLQVRLRKNRVIALLAAAFVCIFLLTSCIESDSDSNGGTSIRTDQSPADSNDVVEDIISPAIQTAADANGPPNVSFGPTVFLSYSKETSRENPISSFMYFVPLISPTLVDRETSDENEQQVSIISYARKVTSKSFTVVCEFEIVGKGFHKNMFDSAEMITEHTTELKKGESLTNTLDYINFEGEGFGRIEVNGIMTGSAPTVTEVDIQFNARGHKSPVTIGLYDIKPKNGQYKYENRSNQSVARVNTLIFKKSETDPRMGIKVASISKSPDSDGFWDSIKGGIANLLIKPPKVDKLGNDTMLDFGHAMLEQKSQFTFPKAENIRENRRLEIFPVQ